MIDCLSMSQKIRSYDNDDNDNYNILSVGDTHDNVGEGCWHSVVAAAVCRGNSDGASEELSEICRAEDEDDGQVKRV